MCCKAMAESVCVTGKEREGERSRSQFWWWHWGRGLLAWKGPVCDHDVIRSIQWDRLEEASVLHYTQGTSLPTGSEQGPECRSDTQEVVSHTQSVRLLAWIHTHTCTLFITGGHPTRNTNGQFCLASDSRQVLLLQNLMNSSICKWTPLWTNVLH